LAVQQDRCTPALCPGQKQRRVLQSETLSMRRLHLDTDLGGDIDDLCALAMVLNWPGVELCAVTTVSDNGGKRAGYARYALELAGRRDIPVCAGADISQGYYHPRQPGFPDEKAYWPEVIQPLPGAVGDAIARLESSIEQGATIAPSGPFTNLALLEKRSPGILSRAHLVLMGGYVFPPRSGFPQWGRDMDYNVQIDVASAEFVFRHSNPTLVPISVTVETALRRAHLPALREAGPMGQLLARQAEAFARDEEMETRFGRSCDGLPHDIINFLHDPLACAIALGWSDGVETREIPVKSEIIDGLLYQTVEAGGKPTRVVTRVNGSEFSEFWLSTVTRCNRRL
jgi:inosine-uridine nucleoside N-ribohydrolase